MPTPAALASAASFLELAALALSADAPPELRFAHHNARQHIEKLLECGRNDEEMLELLLVICSKSTSATFALAVAIAYHHAARRAANDRAHDARTVALSERLHRHHAPQVIRPAAAVAEEVFGFTPRRSAHAPHFEARAAQKRSR